jgi:hypothetical protein
LKFKTILSLLFFTTSVHADQPAILLTDEPRSVPQVAYVATDSICLDGLVAILSGHGCQNIHLGTEVDGQYEVTCTKKQKIDSILNDTYLIVERPNDIGDVLTGSDMMCGDTNLIVLRIKNL